MIRPSCSVAFAVVLAMGGGHAVAQKPAAAPAPEVFLSLRGVAGDTIEVGEPLFVAVRIEAPFEASAPIELAPATGTWADAVAIVLARAGTPLPLRATASGKPASATVKVDAEQPATGEWYFAAAAMQPLAAGDYTLQARLTLRDGGGWKGTVASEPVSLHVVAPGAAPERVLQRTIALANEALVVGDLRAAARLVDTRLADQPDQLRLLSLRARISARAGDLRAARACVTRALGTDEVEQLTHPPIGLLTLRDQIEAALMAPQAPDASPPEWTRLPPRVLAPLRPAAKAAPGSGAGAAPARPDAGSTVASPRASVPQPAPPVAPPTPPAIVAPPPGAVVAAATLTDAGVAADADGQWAVDAKASTQYSAPNYAAAKLVGPPDVPGAGDHANAWCHGSVTGEQWIEVGFATPVHATEVRVRQTSAPGAVVRVEAIEPGGTVHVWWQGKDPYQAPAKPEIAWFAVRVARTSYLVGRVRITLDLAAVPGWKEIDAVQLVGSAK